MKIREYLLNIKKEINKFNNYVSNPFNYRNIKSPYSATQTKTYVWIEGNEKKEIKNDEEKHRWY